MLRSLEPELLDSLAASDPRARRSRRDLRLVNALMGNARPVARALSQTLRDGARIADLGAGDGTFMLRVAGKLPVRAAGVELALVDRIDAVSTETTTRFRALGWQAMPFAADAHEWLERAQPEFDAMVANLFLHHLAPQALRRLLLLASERTRFFVACEPRRSRLALGASRTLALLGCAPETRHDAVLSVKAGFRGSELSQAWPARPGWDLSEGPSGAFSHLFIARRHVAL